VTHSLRLFALVTIVASGVPWRAPQSSTFHVIGYYADWTAARYPIADIPAARLTHVNYAFGKIGPGNKLTWNAAAAVEQVYPGDCSEPGCPHGLFNQITLLKKKQPHWPATGQPRDARNYVPLNAVSDVAN
jgi:GH18 family chitinase